MHPVEDRPLGESFLGSCQRRKICPGTATATVALRCGFSGVQTCIISTIQAFCDEVLTNQPPPPPQRAHVTSTLGHRSSLYCACHAIHPAMSRPWPCQSTIPDPAPPYAPLSQNLTRTQAAPCPARDLGPGESLISDMPWANRIRKPKWPRCMVLTSAYSHSTQCHQNISKRG